MEDDSKCLRLFTEDFRMRFWKHFLGGPLQLTREKTCVEWNALYIVVHMSGQTFFKTDAEVEPGKRNQHRNRKSTYHGGAVFFRYLCWMICPLGSPQIDLLMGLKSTTGLWAMRYTARETQRKKGEICEFQLGNGT